MTQFSRPKGIVPEPLSEFFKYVYACANCKSDTIAVLPNSIGISNDMNGRTYVFGQSSGGFSFKDGRSFSSVVEYFIDTPANASKYRTFKFSVQDLDKCN